MAKKNLSYCEVPFAKILFNPIRLMIVAELQDAECFVPFRELREILELTDGNLAYHMKMLEKDKLIEVKKEFVNGKPSTTFSLTLKGEQDFIALKQWFYDYFLEGGD